MRICKYCKHSHFISVPDLLCYTAECKKYFIINSVDGSKYYIKCEHQNPNGNCQDYEESLFRKLINKLL